MGFFFDDPEDAWRHDAACKGMSANDFHPYQRPGRKIEFPAHVKAACARCPVAEQCLDSALAFERTSGMRIVGFWGGKTPEERHALLEASGGRVNEWGSRMAERDRLVVAGCRAGVSPPVLAAAFGVDPKTVCRITQRQGAANG